MDPVFVKACFDLDCEWEGLAPVYRIYVNDELFAERTWRWTDCKLKEILQISAPPGKYTVRLDPVGPQISKFKTSNHHVEYGPGAWTNTNTLEISA